MLVSHRALEDFSYRILLASGVPQAKSKLIAEALEKQGIEVWWDQDLMPGQGWREEIQKRLASNASLMVTREEKEEELAVA